MPIHLSYAHLSILLFPDNNSIKHQWIFAKLGMSIDSVEILFGIANGHTIVAGHHHFMFLLVIDVL